MKIHMLTPSYLLSLPERVVRSATAVAAGIVRELSDVVIPDFLRRTMLYRNLVDDTLRFLIEHVAEVENVSNPGEAIASKFLLRRTAGDGIDFIGILAFRASPVWILAALADLSGAGRQLVQEIAASMQKDGLLEPGESFTTVEQLLNGLEQTSGSVARTLRMPPLDVSELRRDWNTIRQAAAGMPTDLLPSPDALAEQWAALTREAEEQKRSVFEMSSLMALSAVRTIPDQIAWLGQSAFIAARTTGLVVAGALLDHYTRTLGEIHSAGYLRYWACEFQPYLKAAALQFSPAHGSTTERLLFDRK